MIAHHKQRNNLLNINALLIFTLLTITVFYGCKKEIGEHLLGDLKKQNPYNGSETIVFIDSANSDSIVFLGNGRGSYRIHTPSSASIERYYVNEMDTCCFIEQNNNYRFYIYLASRYDEDGLIDISFIDDNCKSHITSRRIPLFVTHPYIDSLFVNDKYYYKVIVDSSLLRQNAGENNCNNGVLPYSIYYTTTHGIIKIDFEDGTSWELKEIIP